MPLAFNVPSFLRSVCDTPQGRIWLKRWGLRLESGGAIHDIWVTESLWRKVAALWKSQGRQLKVIPVLPLIPMGGAEV